MDQPAPTTRRFQNLISPLLILFLLYAIFFLPFWQPLLLAFLFASACAPIVNYLRSKLHSGEKWTPFLLMALLVTLVVSMLTIGGIKIYSLLYSQFQDPENLAANFDRLTTAKAQIIQWMKHIPFLNDQNIEAQVNNALTSIGNQSREIFINLAKAFVVRTPEILLNLFIFLISFAVLLVWGSKKWAFISKFPGMGSQTDFSNYHHFEKVCAISIGSIFLTGLMQATMVSIGAAITGYPAFLSFLLAFILSLIPVIGAASVPVFLSIITLANGSTGDAIILAVTALIAGTSDNLIRAWLFSKAANTNPVVSLLALLGGISLFGFPGLFLAPIVEQLVMSYFFGQSKEEKSQHFPIKSWRGFSWKSRPRPV